MQTRTTAKRNDGDPRGAVATRALAAAQLVSRGSIPSNIARGIAPISVAAIWTVRGNYLVVEWTVVVVSLVSTVAFVLAARLAPGEKFGGRQVNFK